MCHFDEPPIGGEEKSLTLINKRPLGYARGDRMVVAETSKVGDKTQSPFDKRYPPLASPPKQGGETGSLPELGGDRGGMKKLFVKVSL